jgi:hypothetical protein
MPEAAAANHLNEPRSWARQALAAAKIKSAVAAKATLRCRPILDASPPDSITWLAANNPLAAATIAPAAAKQATKRAALRHPSSAARFQPRTMSSGARMPKAIGK